MILDDDLVTLPGIGIGLLLAVGDFMVPGTRDLGKNKPQMSSAVREFLTEEAFHLSQ